MIYKTYRATNPVRWRDGDGWQVGWRLLRNDPTAKQLWRMSGTEGFAMVLPWGDPHPVFVPEAELEEMPMREDEKSTNLDAKPGTWESNAWINSANPQPFFPLDKAEVASVVPEAELAAARAEANDLMQRLTESQQEVAKVGIQNHSLRVNTSALERDNQLLERDRDEARQELAEVKMERDRLAGQVEASRQKHLSDAHYEGVLESVIAKVRAAIDGK